VPQGHSQRTHINGKEPGTSTLPTQGEAALLAHTLTPHYDVDLYLTPRLDVLRSRRTVRVAIVRRGSYLRHVNLNI